MQQSQNRESGRQGVQGLFVMIAITGLSALILGLCVATASAATATQPTTRPTLDESWNGKDGITIPENDKSAPAGQFGGASFPGNTMTITLRGKEINALLNLSGDWKFTDVGMLARGTKNLLPTEIKTSKSNDQWLTITKFGVVNGCLACVDKAGNLYAIVLGPNMDGAIFVVWAQ